MKLFMALSLLAGLGQLPLEAREVYRLGGDGVAWQEAGTSTFIDAKSLPGGIRPLGTAPEENLIATMAERAGDLSSLVSIYTLPANWQETRIFAIDSDPATAFVHPPRINFFTPGLFYTVPMFFDLGAPFTVDRVRFSTRADFPGNKIRQYKLYVNDGRPESRNDKGDPIWTLVHDEKENLSTVVDLDLDPQVVRHLYLHPFEAGETWEIAEFEVYGRGFVPSAAFVSAPIDLGQISNLGQVRWAGRLDTDAKVLVQIRAGDDDQPEVYWRKTGVADQEVPYGANGRPMSKSQYEALPLNIRGAITQDLDNWTVWRTYDYAQGLAGTRILSGGAHRYVQLRVDFFSDGVVGGQIDWLEFEYSQPPVVDLAIGEIFPASVGAAETTRFTYAVRARLDAGKSGFDRLEISSLGLLEGVQEVRIDRQPVAFEHESDPEDPHWFAVRFPRVVQDQTLLEVDFDARIFTYGTTFDGRISDAATDDVPQDVIPGDAVADFLGDGVVVRTPLQKDLLGAVDRPNPFTPNGDGTNDEVRIWYALLRLTRAVPLAAEIYDLAGQRVRRLGGAQGASAFYQLQWDGRDDSGQMVAPGMYVFRLAVEADSGMEERLGHIAVVY